MKKLILVLIFLISIIAVSHAFATDDSNSDIVCVEDSQVLSVNEVNEILNDSNNHDDVIIQQKIDNADSGQTVDLNGSTYMCDGLIKINKSVVIDGHGSTLIFDGSDKDYTSSFFHIEQSASDVTLKNLKFVGGKLFFGGAVTWQGNNGNIINCTFKDNEAFGDNAIGGAILMTGDNCNVTDCSFYNNRVDKYGGAIFWNGNGGIISNCQFTGNEAKDSNLKEDDNLYGGGALVLCSNNCIIVNCTFSNNLASECGGAISVLGNKNSRILKSKFYNNDVRGLQGGGAIYIASEQLLIDDCVFVANNATKSNGGALSLSDDTIVNNSFFNANFAAKDENGNYYGNDISYFGNISHYNNNIIFNTFVLDFGESIKDAVGVNYEDVYNMIVSDSQNNTFNITKHNSTIEFGEIGMIFEYARSGNIKVVVTNGKIEKNNIHVLNQDKSKIVNAKIDFSNDILTVSGLAVGNYFLRVTTTPDEYYNEASKDLSITVNKATAAIKAQKVTVAYKKGSLWTVKIVDARNNKAIANMKVTLKIYTGKKYKKVNLNTNSRGEVSYQTKGLSAATHKVVVSASHEGYKLNPVTSSIKVVKQTALKFKVKKKTVKNGASLSITVINKKTKKSLNGVKIKLLIKDGKKYKTVTLKTKTKKGKKGFCAYATNKLLVGKHKVKIMPVDIKYSGSASSSMKITKKAKKAPDWETKI